MMYHIVSKITNSYASQLSVTIANAWGNQPMKRKDLFWLTILDSSVYGSNALGKLEYHVGGALWTILLISLTGRKEREWRGG
jgi:hypothetical protein